MAGAETAMGHARSVAGVALGHGLEPDRVWVSYRAALNRQGLGVDRIQEARGAFFEAWKTAPPQLAHDSENQPDPDPFDATRDDHPPVPHMSRSSSWTTTRAIVARHRSEGR